jgi:hypothetical protein
MINRVAYLHENQQMLRRVGIGTTYLSAHINCKFILTSAIRNSRWGQCILHHSLLWQIQLAGVWLYRVSIEIHIKEKSLRFRLPISSIRQLIVKGQTTEHTR